MLVRLMVGPPAVGKSTGPQPCARDGGDYIDESIDEVCRSMPSIEESMSGGWRVVDTSDLSAEQTRDGLPGLG